MASTTRSSTRILLWTGLLATASISFAGPQIDLSAESSRSAPNDLARATAYAEATGPSAADLARSINAQIAQGLQLTKKYPALNVRSGNNQTTPIYGKNRHIEGWRVRSELIIESRDLQAVSEALGKLQGQLNVEQLMLLPAPDTRKKAEDAAIVDAITAFLERAKLVADALGRPFRILRLAVHAQQRPIGPVMRAAALAESGPMPVEAGEAQVGVSVSGQIELEE